ncbi:unnamed protein product, partial [Pocillopora meandrina]
ECGVLVNSRLKSPGYPFSYPANMDCEYSIPIPPGGPMRIHFVDFDVEYHSSCRTGERVAVYGNFANITFHSDPYVEKRGFFFHFKTAWLNLYITIISSECGVLVNSTLKSPGYPVGYPANMDCGYSVPIPPGGPMRIHFVDFDLELQSSCRQDSPLCHDYDFVKIANDQNYTFGEYCGRRTGQTVAVYGNFVFITFHSDPYVEKRGFFFHFKTVPPAPPKISLPAVVESLPGYRVKIPVTGTPPIYTAIIRNSTVLVNTTYIAGFQFYNESNCTSVAFNTYGYDTREFSVILKGREIS